MSRLDDHIEQKIAQRDAIDLAAEALAGEAGLVVEFGLGKGRSYSHLRERFPGREIFCFDRRDHAHPGWGPPPSHVYLGELTDLLQDPVVQARFRAQVLLAHLDLARGDSPDTRLHQCVVSLIQPWLRPHAWILSDRPVALETGWQFRPVEGTARGRCAHRFCVYRRPAS